MSSPTADNAELVHMPRDDDTAITPTRQDEGVTTAPLITAEQEIRGLKAEVERLKSLLEGESSAGHGHAAEEEAAEAWPESGLKITYGENAYQHPNTMTFMRDSFKAGTIRALLRPSIDAVAQRG